jgi:Fe2+ transport system protein FeoA
MADYLRCPLCGFEFEKLDTLCSHGCPLGGSCNFVRCPSCQYEYPPQPRRIPLIARLFGKGKQLPVLPEGIRSLSELKHGDRARVVCLGGDNGSRHNSLAVFGLVEEAEITLLQQRPSCVVQVGETELAIDSEIAADILVEPLGEETD